MGGRYCNELLLLGAAEYDEVGIGAVETFAATACICAPQEADVGEKERYPIDVIVCIDVSASMAGDKLSLTKEAICFLIEHMSPDDQIALVTYNHVSTVVLPLSLISTSREMALEKISLVTSSGMTNLHGGLMLSLDLAETRIRRNSACSILLCTDGQANIGPRHPPTILNDVRRKLARMNGPYSIFSFGFGADHSEELLQQIATDGQGLYCFIETPDSIPESFAECLAGLKTVFARDLKLVFRAPSNDIVLTSVPDKPYSRLGSLPGRSVELSLGDIYCEETRNVLVTVSLPAVDAPGRQRVLALELQYYNLARKKTCALSTHIVVARVARPPPGRKRNLFVDRQLNRRRAAVSLSESHELAGGGDVDAARDALIRAINDLGKSDSLLDGDAYVRSLQSQLKDMEERLRNAINRADKEVLVARACKMLAARAMQHDRQRSALESDEFDLYSNSLKKRYRAKTRKRSGVDIDIY